VKKTGLLNHRLSDVIARVGHTQRIVIADAGLPIPPGVERIDLAVVPGLPGLIDVAHAIARELQVEGIVVADELIARNHAIPNEMRALFPGAELTSVPHETFKEMCESAIAIVRTGECTPYANVMLIAGVTF
jgi:D-ribose pyranase